MARQNFVGLVVSQGRMNKTVKVRVQGKIYDRRIDKEIIRRKDFLCHDEGNICKEGDIVRIESIPKISKLKAFAIAEIKINKGQQFEQYESLAKQRIQEEDLKEIEFFKQNKDKFSKIVTKLEDLKKIDELNYKITNLENLENSSTSNEDSIIVEINKIKSKYNIKSYPSTEPLIDLDLNSPIYKSELEKRVYHMDYILNELLNNSKYEEFKNRILLKKFKDRSLDSIQKSILKNVLRKYVINEENELPFAL
ncbi:uncharacterized protein KGF55_001018 [Candida pseudojiufengensis]|uniref:uncharacterized protein n=1 Tax=Candida pseudojiufengensis TaxID=497109 RepID=UPI00222519BE|nr:uncharacterized protein KGF55_001018 [Candida pseudojiufengensis]KAI5965656.1 hypothetical protein KGF55_001018 [Candida pseudojiufengensis]